MTSFCDAISAAAWTVSSGVSSCMTSTSAAAISGRGLLNIGGREPGVGARSDTDAVFAVGRHEDQRHARRGLIVGNHVLHIDAILAKSLDRLLAKHVVANACQKRHARRRRAPRPRPDSPLSRRRPSRTRHPESSRPDVEYGPSAESCPCSNCPPPQSCRPSTYLLSRTCIADMAAAAATGSRFPCLQSQPSPTSQNHVRRWHTRSSPSPTMNKTNISASKSVGPCRSILELAPDEHAPQRRDHRGTLSQSVGNRRSRPCRRQ